ncbi:membrane hypothetical protein [Candidatus Zixiibacteriota bacterium]|nr:membrane hypothetical protein [candidate division Zixibacteria bacterium]
MYENTLIKIQKTFTDLRRRIDQRFSYLIQIIHSYISLVLAIISGLVGVVTTFIISILQLAGEFLILATCFGIPIIITFFFGLQLGGIWGTLLVIVSIGMAAALVFVAFYGIAGKPDTNDCNYEERPWRVRVILTGMICTSLLIMFHVLYFMHHDPPFNKVVNIIYIVYEQLAPRAENKDNIGEIDVSPLAAAAIPTNPRNKTVPVLYRTNCAIPAVSEVDGKSFFRLLIDSVEIYGKCINCYVSWAQPSGAQTASCNSETYIVDDVGVVYHLKYSSQIDLGSYDNPIGITIPQNQSINATLIFESEIDRSSKEGIRNLNIYFMDVYRKGRIWVARVKLK